MKKKGSNFDIDLLPRHIAIIMDGNGRWAKKRMLPRTAGHRVGADTLDTISREADEIGIKHLTVFAFSTENWKRSKTEVDSLMDLIREYLDRFASKSDKENIKVDFIGDLTKLSSDIREKISFVIDKTSVNIGMNLHIALNYGGRDDIVRAARSLSNDILSGKIIIDDVNESLFNNYLDTSGLPEPELLIRTGGEIRVSNFLLWQLAYSEFYFSAKLWPDFSVNDLLDALMKYQNRDRRFGLVK